MPARSTTKKTATKAVPVGVKAPVNDYDYYSDYDESYDDVSDGVTEEYKVLSDIDHILKRKGMYIGAARNTEIKTYTATIEPTISFTQEKLLISPGLMKMFDELAMNAVDQIEKSGKGKNRVTTISFTVNDNGWFGCADDGKGIPIEPFNKTTKYIPEVLFTQPRSGSNFTETTSGAGQNGIGIKLTTILSSAVELHVVSNKLEYKQLITDNCKTIHAPVIAPIKGPMRNLVSYKFRPDTKAIDGNSSGNSWKLAIENTSKCIIRRILELRSIVDPSVAILINGVMINSFTFNAFASRVWRAYLLTKNVSNDDYTNKCYYIEHKGFKLFIGLSPVFEQVSYVNGIFTEEGGIHVKSLVDIINSVLKSKLGTAKSIKTRLFICMDIKVDNPEFSSQAKTKLTAAKNIENIVKLSTAEILRISDNIGLEEAFNERKQERVDKMFKSKKVTKDCPKLLDAEQAGKKGAFNTLFICEGDSASSLAKIGMTCASIGHKNFGCLPLQGKINNIRDGKDAYSKNLMKDNGDADKVKKSIISQMLITLGAVPNRVYTTANDLRYQRIVVLKDADSDGANILALVYNAIDILIGSVLKIPGFFCEFITPMIKLHLTDTVYRSLKSSIARDFNLSGTIVEYNKMITLPFYNRPKFDAFMEQYSDKLPKSIKVEFVKGLAGHQQYEIKRYFGEYDDNVIPIHYDQFTEELLIKTFSKSTNAPAERREWMNTLPKEGACLERVAGTPINMSDFLNTDHLQYMHDSAARTLPSVMDGLKQVQRKIIYGLRKQSNSHEFRKVFQVSGLIANVANYHHGDQSMNAAIIKMAQDYPGSNNIPLLTGKGFFGSRLELGEDAGQPRYIDVSMSKLTDMIIPKVDDDLLEYVVEDNNIVEPYYYVPIIPLLLINGSNGLGTGYSCHILMHSALSIIEKIKDRLNKNRYETTLIPHVNTWKGEIDATSPKSVYYRGSFTKKSALTIQIHEIPITCAINDLISILNQSDDIERWKNLNSESINSVSFEVTFKQAMDDKQIEKMFKLVDTVANDSCRCACDADNRFVYYTSNDEIFDTWFVERYSLYEKRKEKLINKLELELLILDNKIRFIGDVIEKKIKLYKLSNDELNALLIAEKYFRFNDCFDYLLTMHMSSMTATNRDKLQKEFDAKLHELNELKSTTIEQIWIKELDALIPYIKDLE